MISTTSETIDYEALADHTIVMSVTVSDGNAQDVKELSITVTNQNEPPEFQYEDYSISGNEGEVVNLICCTMLFFKVRHFKQLSISESTNSI